MPEEIKVTRPTGKKIDLHTRETHGIQPIGVRDAESIDTHMPRIDLDKYTLRVGLFVWDSDSGTWEKMEQPSIDLYADDLTVSMGDVEKLLATSYWKDQRMDYLAGKLVYKGLNTAHGISTSDDSWYIQKYTWSAGTMTRIEGPLVGSWDDRATLGWDS